MYQAHFHLNQAPFSISPDPSFLYLSDSHREALAHLMYGFSHGGFVLITGEVGTGKTTLLRNLIKHTPPDLDVAFILNPRLTVRELLETLCDELGVVYPQGAAPTVKLYIDVLSRHLLRTHQSGRSTVVIIDEAQNLSPAVLEQIRLLTNLETDERKLLRIILLGQPELAELLERKELRQLAQRITARYHLAGLSREDTLAYVVHRLSRSGGSPHLFTRRALNRLYRISRGIPRIINIVADRALLGAYVEGKHRVSARIVERAADEVLGERPRFRLWLTVGAVSLAAAGMAWAYFAPPFNAAGRPSAAPAATQLGAPLTADIDRSATANYAEPEPGQEPSRPASTATPAADSAVPLDTQLAAADPPNADPPAASSGGDARVESDDPSALPVATLKRPAGSTYRAHRKAYAAVFDAWGADFANTPNELIPCDFAPSAGLQCLTMHGSWSEINQLNLPVVMELWDGGTSPYYGAITALADGRYQLHVDETIYQVAPSELRDVWFGTFVVLWQTPPGYYGSLRLGMQHATVAWLRQQLAQLTRQPLGTTDGADDRFDAPLRDAVIEFQREQGLITDGVVGPATWIRLADELALPAPHLTR